MYFNVSWVFRCLRWSYFKYRYPKSECFDVEKIRAGLEAEKLVYKYLRPMHPKRGRNRSIYFKKFILTGRPDFTVKGFVIEVKKSQIGIIRPEWRAQLNLYLLLEGTKTGYLFEVGKDKIRVTKIDFSPSLIRESVRYYLKLERFLRENKPPPSVKTWYCNYCSYKILCRKYPKIYSAERDSYFHEGRGFTPGHTQRRKEWFFKDHKKNS